MTAATARRPERLDQPSRTRLAAPRPSRLIDTDLAAALTVFAVCIVGLWIRHGGIAALSNGWIDGWASLSRLTGLLASAFAVLGVVLAGRPASLERLYGMDRLFVWHRVLGDVMGILLALHVATGTAGWIAHSGLSKTLGDLIGGEPYMGLATVGSIIVGLVVVSSLKSLRRRISYETWYLVHLSVYFGFAVSYGHQIVLGTDMSDDQVARWFWAALHIAAVGVVVWGRWGRLVVSCLRPLRVVESRQVAPGVTALSLGGANIGRFRAASGQFAYLRPMRRGMWFKSHPFSLSAAPTRGAMRFTIKDLGTGSAATMGLPVGSRVAVEGPYGVTTSDVFHERKALFIIGGVGVTPARAMLEDLPRGSDPIVLYRARKPSELVHVDELRALTERIGGQVLTLVGPTSALADRDPFGPARLTSLIPQLTDRIAVVCGPERLVHAARAGLRAAGMPDQQIHYERVWW